MSADILLPALRERFADAPIEIDMHRGLLCMELPHDHLLDTCRTVRDAPELSFTQLSDLCGVDYATWGQGDWGTQKSSGTGFSRACKAKAPTDAHPELAVIYHLLSLQHNCRLRLRVFVRDDPPRINSVVDIWASANWYERECYDLFGIFFSGHPDLRRILTDYGFIGHPLRKDFPLEGHVEVRYDPDKKQVIYQAVTIENRVLVPRVLREDNRYEPGNKAD